MTEDPVRWRHDCELDAPIVVVALEGWNDAGDAASWAVRHLATRGDATLFADLDPEEFFDFSEARPMIKIDDDHRDLQWPTTSFSATNVPRELILIQGPEPQLRWRTYANQILDIARRCNARMVVTLGALLAEVPHSRPVTVFGSSEDAEIGDRLELETSTYEGPTGIIGVLNATAHAAGIPTVSLWAAVPNYVSGAASPKAALALLERLQDVLLAPIPTTDLEIAASAYERQITELVSEDADTAGYIRTLEDAYDEDGPDPDPDPETFVEEVERFLRDQ